MCGKSRFQDNKEPDEVFKQTRNTCCKHHNVLEYKTYRDFEELKHQKTSTE